VIKSTQVAALLGFLMAASGQQTASRPDVPAKLEAPSGERVILRASASGSQIYICQVGADQKLSWVLKAPEAELFDAHGKSIGRHYAGPTWKLNDGSEVTGKAIAREDPSEADSIPWLLLTATGHSEGGTLSRVTTIQRIHTKGGQPPQANGCADSKRGAETRSPYSADYYFYAPVR